MRINKASIQIVTFLSFAFTFAQSPNDIDKYLEKKYAREAPISMGSCFYTSEELPKVYNDAVLKKALPDIMMYTFTVKEKGCYGAQSRIGIILIRKGKIIEQLGLWNIGLDQNFNPEFIDIFKEVKLKKSSDFNAYINSVAKLLFSTYYQNDFELNEKNDIFQTFYSKGNGSIKFEFLSNQITNVKYIMSF